MLYVLNRISNTISIVNLASSSIVEEIGTGSFDPTPVVIRNGRGFLYDHKLSGNGTASLRFLPHGRGNGSAGLESG